MTDLPLLVVEDDPDGAEVVRHLLKIAAIPSIIVGSAEAGLAILDSGTAVCGVLVDLRLPEMDGLELVRMIRASGTRPDLTIVGMTAFHTPELRAKALQDGLSAYFPKPLEVQQFVKGMKTLFG